MADRFDCSIVGFADALPYSGPKTKVPTTIARYVHSARRLADWARARGLHGYEELTTRDLRAFLSSLHGRDGGPATEGHKATVWWGIRALFRYLEAEEDVRDIARRISVPQPPQSDRITHLEPADVERLLKACRDRARRPSSASASTPGCGSASWPASPSPTSRSTTSGPATWWFGARAARSAAR